MADIKTEETMTDNGDDDQWLYGDSTSNLDSAGTLVEDIKPAETVGVVEDEVPNITYLFINQKNKYCL